MIMTPEEQKDMLELIEQCQKISEEKTNIMEEIVRTAQALAAENQVLKNENERLKRHLSIAEGALIRFQNLEKITERREAEQYAATDPTRGIPQEMIREPDEY